MKSCAAVLAMILLANIAAAQNAERMKSPANAVTTIGQRNPPLYDGARALLAGNDEDGVRLTLEGLKNCAGQT